MENEKIEIKDKNGVVRIRIGLTEMDNPEISLFDVTGKPRLALDVSPSGSPSALFYDDKGNIVIRLSNWQINNDCISDIELRENNVERVRMSLTTRVTENDYSRGAIGVYQKHAPPYVAFGYEESEARSGCGVSILGTDSGPGITVETNSVANEICIFGHTNMVYHNSDNGSDKE